VNGATGPLLSDIGNGGRLSVYLEPDHTVLDTDDPEYSESYELPFVFCEGDKVSGLTRPTHLVGNRSGNPRLVSFSYNSDGLFYSIIFSDEYEGQSN
jgi:hypothetical protein